LRLQIRLDLTFSEFRTQKTPVREINSIMPDRFSGRLAHWSSEWLSRREAKKKQQSKTNSYEQYHHTQSRRSQEKFGCALAAARCGDARTVNPYKLRRGHSVHSPFRCYCGRARPGRSRLWRVPGNQLSIASHW